MAISQIPALTAHYSESSISQIGRPVLGRCNPCQMAISQIPALLWKLIFGRAQVLADQHPPSYGNFTDFCSENSYFIPTLKAPHLADQVLAHLPPSSMTILQIPDLLWKLIFGRLSVGRSNPHPIIWEFHRFLLWQLIFHSYSESSIFGRPSLWQIYPHCQMAILQIPVKLIFHSYSESSTFGWPVVGRSTPIKYWFHRFLLYSESSYLADQVLADLPPVKWQFYRFLLWQLIFHSYSES